MKRIVLVGVFSLMASAAAASGNSPVAAASELPAAVVPVQLDDADFSKDRTGFSLRGTVSTLGLGGEAAYRFSDEFGVRAPFGSANVDFDGDFEGYNVGASIKTGGIGLMADYFPTGRAFHISAGAFHSDYSLSGTAYDVDVDGMTTDVAIEFRQKREISPIAALGWDWQIGKHGQITADVGAIFGSGFDVTARESSGLASQDRVDAEIADLRDAAGKIKVLPYIKLGVGFRF